MDTSVINKRMVKHWLLFQALDILQNISNPESMSSPWCVPFATGQDSIWHMRVDFLWMLVFLQANSSKSIKRFSAFIRILAIQFGSSFQQHMTKHAAQIATDHNKVFANRI